MSDSQNPRREYPSTYFVQDRFNEEEFTRMRIQDRLVTTTQGGVLPEQDDPMVFRRVLDVGCGVGGWLVETAKTYPHMSLLVGVDVSSKMLDYARAQAEEAQVSDRVEFHAMDALLMLEFPDNYFDLVNQRFGASYLRKWDWPKLLQEYRRVTQPGGVIRITEGQLNMRSSSTALVRLMDISREAFYQAGHIFTPEPDGVTGELASMLERYGLEDVRMRFCTYEYRAGSPGARYLAEDMTGLFRTIIPFLRKWTRLPNDYEEIYQQMVSECQQPDFVASSDLYTFWAKKPL